MEKEKISFWKKNRELWAAFLICSLSMYIFCICSVRLYPERSTLLTGDILKQYIPALRAFVRSIWQGTGITYSWDLFCGMNATEFYGTYVGGSFVNLIYLLFPTMEPEIFLQIAFSLKVGMAGLCFSYFCKKFWNMQGVGVVFFSLFYALCGFQFSISVINYIWMDAIYMLPLILALVKELLEEGKWIPLIPAYCYLFLCNFYMGYVVGCFSALFFVTYFFLYKKVNRKGFGACVKFAVAVVWAAAMATFSLLPIGLFLLHHSPADTTVADSSLVQQNLLLLLSRFSFGIEVSNFVNLPHLYCGIPVILLVGVFFGCKTIEKREKILFGILLGIMLLSTMVLPLYMFWHGFDNPDSWYHRFSYTISFMCVALAFRACREIMQWKPKTLLLIGVVEVLLMTGINVYGCMVNSHQEMSRAVYSGLIGLAWVVFAAVLLFLKKEKRKALAMFAVVLACVEVIANGCMTDRFFQNWQQKDIWEKENQLLLKELANEPGFYRMEFINEYNYSQDTYFGYKSLSDFLSYENYPLKKTLSELGMFTSPRMMRSLGLNPVTQLIMGVKQSHRMSGATQMELTGISGFVYPEYLSLGFMVEDGITDLSFAEEKADIENVFENCNRLAEAMSGNDTEVFLPVPTENITVESHGVELRRDGSDYVLTGDLVDEETKWIDFKVSETDEQVYVAFEGYNTILSSDLPWLYDYYNPLDMGVVGVRYTKPLDYLQSAYVCTVAMAKGTTVDSARCKDIQFYYANTEGIQQFYEKLKSHEMEVLDYKNGYVHGKVTAVEGQKVMFTSIPYDSGWSVEKVNGDGRKEKLSVVPLLDEAFLGVVLPAAGEYELEFCYQPEGLTAGIAISAVAWLAFVVLLGWVSRRALKLERKETVSLS